MIGTAGSTAATTQPVSNGDALHSIINALGDGQAQRELTYRLEQCLVVLRGEIPSSDKANGPEVDTDNLIDLGKRYASQRQTANNRLADAVDELYQIIGA